MSSNSRPNVVSRLQETTFAVWCEDSPEAAAEIRTRALDGHLAHIEANHERYLVAGPFRNGDCERITGSFFVIVARDEADARALMEGDPYISGGLYATVTYRRVTPAAGRWMGGVIWESPDALRNVATGAGN